MIAAGIEQNIQEKCHLIKEHIDDLKRRIERSEASSGNECMKAPTPHYNALWPSVLVSACSLLATYLRITYIVWSCCGTANFSGEDAVDNESEIRKLEHKLSDYRNIIGQQEEMLLQVRVFHAGFFSLIVYMHEHNFFWLSHIHFSRLTPPHTLIVPHWEFVSWL